MNQAFSNIVFLGGAWCFTNTSCPIYQNGGEYCLPRVITLCAMIINPISNIYNCLSLLLLQPIEMRGPHDVANLYPI